MGGKFKSSLHYREISNPLLFAGQGYMWETWIISNFEPPGNITKPSRFGLPR